MTSLFGRGDLLVTCGTAGRGSSLYCQVAGCGSLFRVATGSDLDTDACPWQRVRDVALWSKPLYEWRLWLWQGWPLSEVGGPRGLNIVFYVWRLWLW